VVNSSDREVFKGNNDTFRHRIVSAWIMKVKRRKGRTYLGRGTGQEREAKLKRSETEITS
jgi:hypothetical protein